MFKIVNGTIKITRGDTGRFTLNLKTYAGEPYDYSNDSVLFTVKENTYTKNKLIQKNIIYGEKVAILPSDTANLSYGEYFYDVQVTMSDGTVDTVIVPSKFVVMQEVTF